MKRKSLPIVMAATFALSAPLFAGGGHQGAHTQDRHGDAGGYSHSMNSDTVRKVQQALREKGHNPGAIDGVYGPQTAQALREFQRSQSLVASGRMDQDTLANLGVGWEATPDRSTAPDASTRAEGASSSYGT